MLIVNVQSESSGYFNWRWCFEQIEDTVRNSLTLFNYSLVAKMSSMREICDSINLRVCSERRLY
jgi:hypothetical protein